MKANTFIQCVVIFAVIFKYQNSLSQGVDSSLSIFESTAIKDSTQIVKSEEANPGITGYMDSVLNERAKTERDLYSSEVSAFIQKGNQRRDEKGNNISESIKQSNYVPNEVIVHFKSGTILTSYNKKSYDLSEVTIEQKVKDILVKLDISQIEKVLPNFSSGDTIRTNRLGKKIRIPDLSQLVVIRSDKKTTTELMEALEESSNIIFVEPNFQMEAKLVPNDYTYWAQVYLDNETYDQDIDAETAWDVTTGEYDVKIGIIDSGIDYNHDDLGNGFGAGYKVGGGWDYIDDDSNPMDIGGHGTEVAGAAAALTNNFYYGSPTGKIAGIAGGWGYDRGYGTGNKGAQLVALRVASTGDADGDKVVQAIYDYATNVEVFNFSYGSEDYFESLRGALNYAARMNAVFVSPMGNDNDDVKEYPAGFDDSWVIAVGGTDVYGNRWDDGGDDGSNYGSWIDVVAQAKNVLTTFLGPLSDDIDTDTGTSLAAPQVAGLAALLLSYNPDLHAEDVQGIIKASAEEPSGDTTPGFDPFFGYGRINASRALEMLQSPWSMNHYTVNGGQEYQSWNTDKIELYNPGGGLAADHYLAKRYEVRKTVGLPDIFSESYAWGLGPNETVGWSAANPNYQTGYTEVVSYTGNSIELKTFVYQIWDMQGSYKGWYPTTPENVVMAYTIIGNSEGGGSEGSLIAEDKFDGNNASMYHPVEGSWYPSNDMYVCNNYVGSYHTRSYRNSFSPNTDYTVKADYVYQQFNFWDEAHLYIRWQNSDNYVGIRTINRFGSWRVEYFQRKNGSWQEGILTYLNSLNVGQTYQLKIKASGSNYQGYVNTGNGFQGPYSFSFGSTVPYGSIALGANSTNVAFDNIAVYTNDGGGGGGSEDYALSFAGGTSRQEVSVGLVSTPGNQYTVEAWVKPMTSSGNLTIVGQHASSGDAKGTIDLDNGRVRFLITTSSLTQMYSNSTVPAGVWTHIAGVYNSNTMKIYINGNEDASVSKSGNITGNNYRSTRIGGYAGTYAGSDGWFYGTLDEVRIWNVARSQAQLQANKNHEIEAQSGLIGYWQFDEGQGSATIDVSGNGHDGILTNYNGSGIPNWVTDSFPSSKMVVNNNWTALPTKTRLHNNYPNPFNPVTTITYDLGKIENTRLEIYDLLGQKIRTLVNAEQNQGNYQVSWDGKTDSGIDVSTGVYIYSLITPEQTLNRKMILIR